MKIVDNLPVGIRYHEQWHHAYTLRPLTLLGELAAMDALDELPPEMYQPQSAVAADNRRAATVESLAYLAQQLTVDGIPADVLTVSWLLDNMTPDDFSALLSAQGALKAKLSAAGAGQPAAANKIATPMPPPISATDSAAS